MFKIQDGRERFFQWDLNRKLIVEDSSITQVHFSNAIYTTALVCEVIDGLVNVPNILLQDYFDIYVYGYDKDYTKHSAIFNVEKRSKPESYVYTETEILNYNVLLDRINQVDENIEESVAIYLEQNPPTVKLDGYATEEYVDNAVAAIEIPEVDLTNYYTKPEANAKFATKEEIPSTSGLATEEFVNSKVSGLATESYVNNANSNVLQTVSQNYALKSEIPSTTGLATESYVDNAVANVKVDLTGYATESYVDEAIAGIQIPEVDLSNYYTKSEVESLIPNTSGFITMAQVEAKGYQTAEQVSTAINEALGVIENGTY